MDVEKLTLRASKALNDAYQLAVEKHHQSVVVIHLFSALVNQEDGLIPMVVALPKIRSIRFVDQTIISSSCLMIP